MVLHFLFRISDTKLSTLLTSRHTNKVKGWTGRKIADHFEREGRFTLTTAHKTVLGTL
jgi:hypothetical protein